jgi:hypothetical protein
MNRSNTIATRKTISFFLAFMLIAGTIAATFLSPSFMTEAHAALSADYEKMMKMNDDDNNYKSKYQSSYYKNDDINCNNFNLNANGFNVNAIPESLRSLIASQTQPEDSQAEVEGTDIDTSTYGNDEKRFGSYDNKKDFIYKCVNNNKNEQPIPTSPTQPPIGSVDSVFVEWTDSGQILFRASSDGGQTFGTTQPISDSEGSDGDITSVGQNIYIVWKSDDVPGGDDEIFFRASTDGGQTFGPILNLSNNPTESQLGRVAAYGQNVYVVWEDTALGNEEIFFRASNNGGQTFGQVQNLSMDQVASDNPDIYAYGQNVYVVWNAFDPSTGDFEVFFKASTNGGQTFGQVQNLSSNTGTSDSPKIAAYGQNVYVVWEDETSGNEPEIFFRASINGGQTFGDIQNLSNNDGFSINPRVATFGQNVYVVWQDNTLGNSEIFFRSSTNNGQAFGSEENLSTDNISSERPDIGVSGQNVYVVWSNDPETNSEIFYRASTDGGQTFGDIQNISMTPGDSILPGIAVSSFPQIRSNTELQQQLSTNDIVTTTGNNNNEPTSIQNIAEQKEEQQLMEEQRIQDSPGLTALEKIEKLKKQWLELLP